MYRSDNWQWRITERKSSVNDDCVSSNTSILNIGLILYLNVGTDVRTRYFLVRSRKACPKIITALGWSWNQDVYGRTGPRQLIQLFDSTCCVINLHETEYLANPGDSTVVQRNAWLTFGVQHIPAVRKWSLAYMTCTLTFTLPLPNKS
jgi:hypothetical protein